MSGIRFRLESDSPAGTDLAEWEDLLVRTGGHYMQHPAWWSVTAAGSRHVNPLYLSGRRDGRLVVAAVLELQSARAFWGRYLRCHRGPVFETPDDLAAAVEFLAGRPGTVRIHLQPYATDERSDRAQEVLSRLRFERVSSGYHTASSRLILDRSEEDILKTFRSSHRQRIRQAEKLGIEVRVLETLDEYRGLAELHRHMSEAYGLPPVPDPAWEACWNGFVEPGRPGFALGAWHEGRLIAGDVVVCVGPLAWEWHAATTPGLKLPMSHGVQWGAIQRLRSAGCRTYDLGGCVDAESPLVTDEDRARLGPITDFKRGFGGEWVRFPPAFARLVSPLRARMRQAYLWVLGAGGKS